MWELRTIDQVNRFCAVANSLEYVTGLITLLMGEKSIVRECALLSYYLVCTPVQCSHQDSASLRPSAQSTARLFDELIEHLVFACVSPFQSQVEAYSTRNWLQSNTDTTPSELSPYLANALSNITSRLATYKDGLSSSAYLSVAHHTLARLDEVLVDGIFPSSRLLKLFDRDIVQIVYDLERTTAILSHVDPAPLPKYLPTRGIILQHLIPISLQNAGCSQAT